MMIRVLIVDDSILFRNQMNLAFKDCPDIVVVGSVTNGKNALDFLRSNPVDVCVLDVEMPVMDGLETLEALRANDITVRTIMFSAHSRSSARKTLRAMELGAMDFVTKPDADGSALTPAEKIRDALVPRIRSICEKKIVEPEKPWKPQPADWSRFLARIIVIASSTGGPKALSEFFTAMGNSYVPVPVVIVQHMPVLFTTMLAEQIAGITGKTCTEAVHGEVLKPNQIYVVPGNYHLKLEECAQGVRAQLDQGELRNYVRPCADYLFETAADIFAASTLGIVFTGMGRDGADGCRRIKEKGGVVMIQDQESSVVYGMPGAVAQHGLNDFTGRPSDIAAKLKSLFAPAGRSHVA